jgi:hypothetical protein
VKSEPRSVLEGTLVAGTGAALVYLGQWASSSDAGPWGPALAAAAAVLVNVIRKLASASVNPPSDPGPGTPPPLRIAG